MCSTLFIDSASLHVKRQEAPLSKMKTKSNQPMDASELQMIWRAVDKILSGVQFERIWPNFKPYHFALYFEDTMCFQGAVMARPSHFMGNTSVMHEGEAIAIWNMAYTRIENEASLDMLAANMVHEMFHAFQREEQETRFPDDLKLLLYPHDATLTALTRREYRQLTDERRSAMRRLDDVAGIREEKAMLLSHFCCEEYRAETAEGLAEFVGLKALSQFNSSLFYTTKTRYERYLLDDRYLFEPRRRAYYSGALIALLAEAAGCPIQHKLSETRALWTLLDIAPRPFESLERVEIYEAERLLEEELRRRRALLESFLQRFPNERTLDASIVGYDPMNLTRVDDYLISAHVLILDDGTIPQHMMGDQLLRMVPGDPRQVRAIAF